MKVSVNVLLLFAIFAETWRDVRPSCVLESDFGLIINCAFKKSTLFRVRNLGGVKAHISLGLSIGDELGFKESISNTEINRRRSVANSKIQAQIVEAQNAKDRKAVAARSSQNSTSQAENILDSNSTNLQDFDNNSTTPTIPQFNPLPTVLITPENSTALTPEANHSAALIQRVPSSSPETTSNLIQTEEALAVDTSPKNIAKQKSKSRSSKRRLHSVVKLTSAPEEYFPAGYDKPIDENFLVTAKQSKTSFQCKNQLYFPGLYADLDLGCMVFHVCVVVDTGIVTRSFLCPESTLFDQRTLKCNWWFYVDCKKSKDYYETNGPVSRSYQIMRAIAFLTGNRRFLETGPITPVIAREKD